MCSDVRHEPGFVRSPASPSFEVELKSDSRASGGLADRHMCVLLLDRLEPGSARLEPGSARLEPARGSLWLEPARAGRKGQKSARA